MQTQSQPIDFNPPTHDAPPIMLPEARRIFAERASRFSHLAEGHSLGDWLAFLGELSRAQHDVLAEMTPMPLPDAAQLAQSRSFGMPPLNPGPQSLPPFWRDAVRHLAHRLLKPAPEVGRPTLEALITASDAQLEIWARLLLDGEPKAADVPYLPFVAAALQVVFTGQASRLDVSQLQRLDVPGVCPCCGSLPVASVVRQAAGIANLRYLHCSLCNTEACAIPNGIWRAPPAPPAATMKRSSSIRSKAAMVQSAPKPAMPARVT